MLYLVCGVTPPHFDLVLQLKTIWVFPKIGRKPPKWMVYNGKPFLNGWFGVQYPYFWKHPIIYHILIFHHNPANLPGGQYVLFWSSYSKCSCWKDALNWFWVKKNISPTIAILSGLRQICLKKTCLFEGNTVAGRNPVNSPVEVATLPHHLPGFSTIPGGGMYFWSIGIMWGSYEFAQTVFVHEHTM